MSATDLSKVKSVIQRNDAQSCNKYLAAGWVLLSTTGGKDESDYPITQFALGWAKDGEPVHPD